jgi:predicted transcriptional regulator
MNISNAIGSLVKGALLLGVVYGILNWQEIGPVSDDVRDFAENACITEIKQEFDVTRVRAFSIEETINGYTVHASVTLAKGNTASVKCLTNVHGGVRDIVIEER